MSSENFTQSAKHYIQGYFTLFLFFMFCVCEKKCNTLSLNLFFLCKILNPFWLNELPLALSGKISRQHSLYFSYFTQKQDLTFHAICLPRRQFVQNVKPYYLGENKIAVC